MRATLYLLLIFLLLYSGTTYISLTSSHRLKGPPFNWSSKHIQIVTIISQFVHFFSLFLGGILAAFIFPIYVVFFAGFGCLIVAIPLFEIIAIDDVAHLTNVTNFNGSNGFFDQNYIGIVMVFFVLFNIYAGFSKFILLVVLLDQDEDMSIERTATCYVFTLNLSYLLAFDFYPSIKSHDLYFKLSLPAILLAIILCVIGRWRNYYSLKSGPINIIEIMLKRSISASNIFSIRRSSSDSRNSTNNRNSTDSIMSNTTQSRRTLLSFSKLCIIFISLLPYGICESQIRITYVPQSNYLRQPRGHYYAYKDGFWPQTINCLGVIVFILIFEGLRRVWKLFNQLYSQKIWRIILGNIFVFLSILSAAVVETVRLNVYWGSSTSWTPSNNVINQTIDGTQYQAADMSVFYQTPQLLLASISEILMFTTCAEVVYKQSLGGMRYLAISFFLGVIGSGGATDVISIGLTFPLTDNLFDLSNLNKRTSENFTCCLYESRMDHWFYILAGIYVPLIVLTSIVLRKFKHYYVVERRVELTNVTVD